MQAMQQMTYAAKGLAGLLAGWVFGFGLMWVAAILGMYMKTQTLEMPDRALLGGMLLVIGMLAVVLVSAGLAEMRRVPTWLTSFLLGMATSPVLTVFGFFWWTWSD